MCGALSVCQDLLPTPIPFHSREGSGSILDQNCMWCERMRKPSTDTQQVLSPASAQRPDPSSVDRSGDWETRTSLWAVSFPVRVQWLQTEQTADSAWQGPHILLPNPRLGATTLARQVPGEGCFWSLSEGAWSHPPLRVCRVQRPEPSSHHLKKIPAQDWTHREETAHTRVGTTGS